MRVLLTTIFIISVLGCNTDSENVETSTFLQKYDGSVWSEISSGGLADRLGLYNSTSIFIVLKNINSSYCETFNQGFNSTGIGGYNNSTITIEKNTPTQLKFIEKSEIPGSEEWTFTISGANVLNINIEIKNSNGDTIDTDSTTYTLITDESNLTC